MNFVRRFCVTLNGFYLENELAALTHISIACGCRKFNITIINYIICSYRHFLPCRNHGIIGNTYIELQAGKQSVVIFGFNFRSELNFYVAVVMNNNTKSRFIAGHNPVKRERTAT